MLAIRQFLTFVTHYLIRRISYTISFFSYPGKSLPARQFIPWIFFIRGNKTATNTKAIRLVLLTTTTFGRMQLAHMCNFK